MERVIKTVLLIEDDADTAKLVIDTLEEHAFTCVRARTAVSGLKKARVHQPNLILLDLMLPKMSGFGFLRQLQRHMDLKKIPVLILSALNDQDITREGLDLGAVGFLTKASIARELLPTVREYVS